MWCDLLRIMQAGCGGSAAVEACHLHPNQLKSLASRGQGYLFASRPRGMRATPIAYGPMPELPAPPAEPLLQND
jgi:hypothetical protein